MNNLSKNIHWLLRMSLAITFLVHGYPKLLDCSGLISMGMPSFLAYLIGPFEVGGAILLLIGGFVTKFSLMNYKITGSCLTRFGSILIAIVMCGAIFIVHLHDGWKGMEWQVLILSVSLLFIIKGNDV